MRSAVLLNMAWRNLWRHPKRTLMTILAMSLTNALFIFMLAFQLGSYDNMKTQSLSLLDGFGQFQHPAFLEVPSLRHSFQIPPNLENRVQQLPGLVASGYRTQAFGLLSAGDFNQGALVLGVQPLNEPKLSTLPNLIQQGRFLNAEDSNHIVIGEALAQLLKVNVGEEIQLLGQDKDGSLAAERFTLVGIFRSGTHELDRQLTLIPFDHAQTLFALPHQAHQFVVITQPFQHIETLTPQLQQLAAEVDLSYRDWTQLQPGVAQGIKLDFYSGFIWYIAILLIVVLILFNTLLMSALEREREFGLMLSLGLSRKQLAILTQLETHFTLGLGTVFGMLVGISITLYFTQTGITLPGTEDMFKQYGMSASIYPTLNALAICFAPVFLWLSSWLMSMMIVWRLFKLHPLSGRQTK